MGKRSENAEKKAKERCEALAAMISGVKKAYSKINADQKSFIETTIGAAIWYLPKIEGWFSGYISKDALEKNNGKYSEEHIFPRKVSAKELLNEKSLDGKYVFESYKKRYCKICILTPEENKKAIKFQKENKFTRPEDVYAKLPVSFKEISEDEYKKLKKKDDVMRNKIKQRRDVKKMKIDL